MIADRIKLARRKSGLSLRDLAAEMEHRVTAQAIGKYERGEDIPSSGVLDALAKAMRVSKSYLMDAHGIVLAGVEFEPKRTRPPPTARQSRPRSWSGSSAICRSSMCSSLIARNGNRQ